MDVDPKRVAQVLAGRIQFVEVNEHEHELAKAILDEQITIRTEAAQFGRDALNEGHTIVYIDDPGRVVQKTPDGNITVPRELA